MRDNTTRVRLAFAHGPLVSRRIWKVEYRSVSLHVANVKYNA